LEDYDAPVPDNLFITTWVFIMALAIIYAVFTYFTPEAGLFLE